jgi:hypothetical protein
MIRLTFGTLVLLSSIIAQQTKYVKTKVHEGITIALPQEFSPMDEQELNRKFMGGKPPVAAFSDYSKTIDLGVNIAYSRWNEEDLRIMKSFYKANILGLYDEVEFLTESIEDINGRKFAVFEFVSTVNDVEGTTINQNSISKFIRIQYAIVKGKTVLFNFSCPARVREQWAPIARQTLQSVKISKTL